MNASLTYALEPFPIPRERPAVFLVGPTPRREGVPSWRPEAIELLADLPISIIIPEPRDGQWTEDYTQQVDWELNSLDAATVILAWVPRDLKDMPAFTTNVEFGLYVKTGRLFYGRPDGAPKTRYLDRLYERAAWREPANTIVKLCDEVRAKLSE